MNLLLDTHVLIWHVTGDPKLPVKVSNAITAPGTRRFVSVATIWEAEIKGGLGKLQLDVDMIEAARGADAQLLPIEAEDAVSAARLPLHHRDPFDRMIVAHAMRHKLTLVTHDRVMERYLVPLLLA